MDARHRQRLVDRYTWLFIAPMCLFWITPVLVFLMQVWEDGQGPSIRVWPFGIAVAAFPLILPKRWYRPRAGELRGRGYRVLGIRAFKRWVPNGDLMNRWLRRHEPNYRVLRDEASLRAFVDGMDTSERWHLALFIGGMLVVVHALRIERFGWALYLLVTDILVNLYPVLLQRFTRARLLRLGHRAHFSAVATTAPPTRRRSG